MGSIKKCDTYSIIHNKGLRTQSHIVFESSSSRPRKLPLLRKCIDIVPHTESTQNLLPGYIRLSSANQFHYQIYLNNLNQSLPQRYYLRVVQGPPFYLNGSYAINAPLCHGDNVMFNDCKIQCYLNDQRCVSRSVAEEGVGGITPQVLFSSITILIEGETGTGKSYLAKKVHSESGRSGKFIHLNISSFSEGVIESELFGHMKGAFTGAHGRKVGAFEQAHNGTLFLDEIDSLSKALQVKLLLFLDNGMIRPVGSSSEIHINVRLIIASGQSLKKLMEQQKIRADFYFRLSSGFKTMLAPLREDRDKIIDICQNFAREHHIVIDKQLLSYYTQLYWPGNIRQLLGHLHLKKVMTVGNYFHKDAVDQNITN